MRRSPLLLLAMLLPGCVLLPQEPTRTASSPIVPAKQFKTAGAVCVLGDVEKAAVTPDEFIAHVGQLLNDQRPQSARRYVERFPDVALDALRQATNAQAKYATVRFIAEVHDEQCGNSQNGWLMLLNDRAANPARYAEYDAARPKVGAVLQAGHVDEAVKTQLPKFAGCKNGIFGPLAADAWQLHGTALLQADKPAEAATAFADAIQAGADAYQIVTLLLFKSDALRRAGQNEAANSAWQEVVERAAALKPCLNDPIFWERVSFHRPVEFAWPEAVLLAFLNRERKPNEPPVESLTSFGPNPTGQNYEAIIWAGIGEMRLRRGEAQAALVACKRTESFTLPIALHRRMQLAQAQALLMLRQEASAMALLATMVNSPDKETAAPALAMLGAIKMQNGSPGQGQMLLEQAMERGEWPERADAEADLGLAFLTQGNEADGLAWLHSAQERFEKAGDRAALVQSLTNEMNYYSHTKHPGEAEKLHQRLAALEANGAACGVATLKNP